MTIQGLQSLRAGGARADLFAYRGDGGAASRSRRSASGTLPGRSMLALGARASWGAVLPRHSAPSPPRSSRSSARSNHCRTRKGWCELMLRRATRRARSAAFAPGGGSGPAAGLTRPFFTRWCGSRSVSGVTPPASAAADRFATLWALRGPTTHGTAARCGTTDGRRTPRGGARRRRAAGRDLAIRRVAMTAIAIERYRRAHGGQLPATLDALLPSTSPAVPRIRSPAAVVYKPAGTATWCQCGPNARITASSTARIAQSVPLPGNGFRLKVPPRPVK